MLLKLFELRPVIRCTCQVLDDQLHLLLLWQSLPRPERSSDGSNVVCQIRKAIIVQNLLRQFILLYLTVPL